MNKLEEFTDTSHSDGILLTIIKCDSCHDPIATCRELKFIPEKKPCYSVWLCEPCGIIHNKFVGDTVQENERLKQELKKLKENLK